VKLDNKPSPKKDVGKVLLEELQRASQPSSGRNRLLQTLMIPVLAVITGLIFGAIFIILTSENVYTAFDQSLGAGFLEAWQTVTRAYTALFTGSIGDPS
jgi:general nucleoside transport system permease protein